MPFSSLVLRGPVRGGHSAVAGAQDRGAVGRDFLGARHLRAHLRHLLPGAGGKSAAHRRSGRCPWGHLHGLCFRPHRALHPGTCRSAGRRVLSVLARERHRRVGLGRAALLPPIRDRAVRDHRRHCPGDGLSRGSPRHGSGGRASGRCSRLRARVALDQSAQRGPALASFRERARRRCGNAPQAQRRPARARAPGASTPRAPRPPPRPDPVRTPPHRARFSPAPHAIVRQ